MDNTQIDKKEPWREPSAQVRVPTAFWLEAEIRRLSCGEGVGVYVVARGDEEAGVVLVKSAGREGSCRLYTQQRDVEGKIGWMDVFGTLPVPEREAQDYIQRARDRDSDLWVVEIEDREMRNLFVL